MSKKIPEVLFAAQAIDGSLIFSNPDHLQRYNIEHDREPLLVHIEPIADMSEKMQLYAFYHVNILECAVVGYTAAGWPGMDKVKADFMLRAEFAKTFQQTPTGDYIPIIIDKRSMTKARLLKFVQDCIFFIENDLETTVPSSEEYKVRKATGRNFKEVKK